jgi:threonine synthase
MRYYSTNDQTHQATLEEAVLKGRADDGGLYLPEHIPVLPQAFVSNLQAMSLQEMSYAVANYALQGDVEASVLHNIVYDSLNFPIPLVYVGGNRFALELFHGPTMSFKDVGMRFMARMVSYFTKQHHQEINVLVTTSGNTGGAVASGFYGIPGVNVYILYPQDTLSPLQEAQFTTLGGNVTALEVNGTLDDCREMVAEAFSDKELNERMHLTSARTINMARLLPQVFYYFFAFAQLAEREQNVDQLVFAVPCGNLGNLTAGVMARQMGLPVKRFIAADNCNDIFPPWT